MPLYVTQLQYVLICYQQYNQQSECMRTSEVEAILASLDARSQNCVWKYCLKKYKFVEVLFTTVHDRTWRPYEVYRQFSFRYDEN
jgi:hypothetical protein